MLMGSIEGVCLVVFFVLLFLGLVWLQPNSYVQHAITLTVLQCKNRQMTKKVENKCIHSRRWQYHCINSVQPVIYLKVMGYKDKHFQVILSDYNNFLCIHCDLQQVNMCFLHVISTFYTINVGFDYLLASLFMWNLSFRHDSSCN